MKIPFIKTALLIFLLVIYNNEKSIAQAPSSTISNITPPSAAAYELGKYGQAQVGLFTGTNNVSIPLYEYCTQNLSVPISLQYSSNGIKVDELGSNVGLSWSLNMGGVITRIVRDLPDETRDNFIPEEEIHKPNSLTNPDVITYFDNAGNNPSIDSEADLFFFNFNGYSGKFVFDNDHKIMLLPKQDIKVETTIIDNNKQGFKITTADGTVYNFSEIELSQNKAHGADPFAQFYQSAWYLTSIKHPNGDEIIFEYGEKCQYNYVASQLQSLIVVPWQSVCASNLPVNYAAPQSVVNYHLYVIGSRLTAIHSNIEEQGKIIISYGVINPLAIGNELISSIKVVGKYQQEIEKFDFTYLTTNNKRMFLEKVSYKDPTKIYKLDYLQPEKFPPRLSYDQDHWGYCNGEGNSNRYLFPNPNSSGSDVPDEVKQKFNDGANKSPNPAYAKCGMLKRITYPTNGYSEYTYEANTYAGKKIIYPNTVSQDMKIYVVTGDKCSLTNKPENTLNISNVAYDQKVKLLLDISLPRQEGCCDNPMLDKISSKISIEDLTDPTITGILSGSSFVSNDYTFTASNVNVDDIYATLKEGHVYKCTLSSVNYFCQESFFGITYGNQKPYDIDFNHLTGGMRLQKVEVNDGINNNPQINKYHYAQKENLNKSTGEQNPVPHYLARRTNRVTCPLLGDYQDTYYYELTSSSLNSLYSAINSNTCGYNYVTVSHGGDNFENGGEEHQFIIEHDGPGDMLLGANILTAPWSNFGKFNGKEKSVKILKNNSNVLIKVKEQQNEYKIDDRYHDVVYSYAVQKRCEKPPVTGNSSKIENLNITEYQSVSRWEYLNNSTTTTYDENGQNPSTTTTSYTYGNPIHLQPTNITTSLDNGGTSNPHQLITHTMYPQDYNLTGALSGTAAVLKKMADRNMINVPIEQTKISVKGMDVHVVDGQVTTYKMNNNFIVKDKDFKLKFNRSGTSNQDLITFEPSSINSGGNFTLDAHYNNEINVYNEYDANNNLLELKDRKNLYSFIREPGTGNVWAKTLHAKYNDIAYSSFEHDDINKDFTRWWYTNTNIVTLAAFNGNKALKLKDGNEGYVKSNAPLSKDQNYKISFWAIDGSVNVNTMEGEQLTSKRSLLTLRTGPTRQGWTYYEGVFSNAILVILSGSATIDELRLYPVNARMHSYVHKMAQGVISECNENNQKTDYLYDEFNRLKLVKDQDGNILKKNEYKYQASY